jgi:hypothetical protein
MKKELLFLAIVLLGFQLSNAQAPKKDEPKKDDGKKKTSIKEKIESIPDALIAQSDQPVDTNAQRIVNDNLYVTVPAMWREKGSMIFNDFKLPKADVEPLNTTFPLPDKKIAQGLQVNLGSNKKSPADKKAALMAQVKSHLVAFYKEAGQSYSGKQLDDKVNSMISAGEPFTTAQGQKGDLYFINDIQSQQSNFIVLLLIPGPTPGGSTFAQFQYYRYIYETTFPEDVMEWKFFTYPDDEQAYVDFTKKILKTFVIKEK